MLFFNESAYDFRVVVVVAYSNPPLEVQVSANSIQLVAIARDQIQLEVRASVVAPHKLTIKRVNFEQMDVNGIPFRLNPVVQTLLLKAKTPTEFPPLTVNVGIGDLHSVEPLIAAARSGVATVHGQARVALDLTFFERMLSGHPSGELTIAVTGDIPFSVPGGDAGVSAMVLGLRAWQMLMSTVGSGVH